MAAQKKTQGFEKSLIRLEEIVELLEEDGELDLDKALALFEEGVRLAGECGKQLDQAEKKVTLLLKDREKGLIETPFESEE